MADRVERSTSRTFLVEVTVDPLRNEDIEDTDEILVTLNGRPLKRFKRWQAGRAGLILSDNYR